MRRPTSARVERSDRRPIERAPTFSERPKQRVIATGVSAPSGTRAANTSW
jgi:hypothetical protein